MPKVKSTKSSRSATVKNKQKQSNLDSMCEEFQKGFDDLATHLNAHYDLSGQLTVSEDFYYVDYTERCEIKLAKFATYEQTLEFTVKFLRDSYGNPDNFLNKIFKGRILVSEND